MARNPKILLIEDDTSVANLIIRYLNEEFLSVEYFNNGAEGLQYAMKELPKVTILDLNLPDMNGMEVLKSLHKEKIPTDVIIITGHGNVNTAVEAMQYGCFNFLEKPFNGERLTVSVKNALEHNRLSTIENDYEQLRIKNFENFIGESNVMQNVYKTIESAAPSKASVFILGESGTGKELCAEAIHNTSQRKQHEFVPLNCAAIPKDLVESEIFGHVKGAFTGATAHRQGAVDKADGGTLFLDEIGEMNIDLQAKLLRFLQTGQFQKVGSNALNQVDVRIVCATNRNPLEAINAGHFREDLYYRLNVIPIQLPSLQERERDVILIARHFLKLFAQEENKQFARFDKAVEAQFMDYHWPGNVRQLENVIRNIVVLNNGKTVNVNMLPPDIGSVAVKVNRHHNSEILKEERPEPVTQAHTATSLMDIKPLWMVERDAILEAIELCDGNIPKAAAMLDVSPSTIYRKKQSWINE